MCGLPVCVAGRRPIPLAQLVAERFSVRASDCGLRWSRADSGNGRSTPGRPNASTPPWHLGADCLGELEGNHHHRAPHQVVRDIHAGPECRALPALKVSLEPGVERLKFGFNAPAHPPEGNAGGLQVLDSLVGARKPLGEALLALVDAIGEALLDLVDAIDDALSRPGRGARRRLPIRRKCPSGVVRSVPSSLAPVP